MLEPLSEVGDLGVNTESVRPGTAPAPADNSYQSQGLVLAGVSGYQGTPAVSLAGVLPSRHQAGADHVLLHDGVHGATLPLREDRHSDMMESGRELYPAFSLAPLQ